MKIILFYGEVMPHGQVLFDQLQKLDFACVTATTPGEIEQLGNHAKKVAVVFMDSKLAYRFLKENKWGNFSILKVLFVQKKPIITPDVEKKLQDVSLKLYYPATLDQLVTKINNFYSDIKEETAEIEFSIHQDMEE